MKTLTYDYSKQYIDYLLEKRNNMINEIDEIDQILKNDNILDEGGNINLERYNVFKKITEATLLIEKDITENKLYGYGIVDSLFDGVEKIFPEISESDEDIIIDIILDNLEKKGISFSF